MGGSSPHMRGTGEAETITVQMPGIIPAHAGNSGSGGHPTRRHRDHPRTCGEQDMIPATEIAPLGSSPHMRGTADGYESVEDNGGIIPAHAGNSLSLVTSHRSEQGRVGTEGKYPGSPYN